MQSLSQRTATFLIKDNKVLLGYKKTGFGSGNYLGIGGKVETGESLEQASQRELEEEIKVVNSELEKVAELTFLFPEKPSWSQQVYVYLSRSWKNDPQETEEIKPMWVNFNDLPLTQMWDDAQFWLPAILNGHSLEGTFTFNADLKVVNVELIEKDFR